jgi:uncharacterized protein
LSNGTRTNNSRDLRDWLATNPTGTTDADFLLFGDFNAYHKEDPLTTLEAAGYSNLLPITSYSYVFSGQWGSLDHALANSSMVTQVTAAEKWHINSDEPSVLDYNTEFKSVAQVTSLYAADAFRSSDHDPVVIGLNLTAPASPTVGLTGASSTNTGVSYSLGITAAPAASSSLTGLSVNWGDGSALENLAVSATTASHTFSSAGNFTISVTATDANTLTANATKTVAVTLPIPTIGISGLGSVTVNTSYTLTIAALAVSGSSITALSVNWGDGSAVDNLGVSATTATHTFSSAGNFTVTATVTDANTQTASATQAITVNAASGCTGTGGVVISQVYGGGGATTGTPTFTKDFVELKNNSTSAISLSGRSLQYGSSTGNYGASATNIFALSGTIVPCGYYLVALGTAGTVGATLSPAADVTSTNLSMAATNGKVALVTTTTSLGCGATATACTFPNTNILDAVAYGPASVSGEGAPTVVLSNILAALRNSNGCTDTNINTLDFTIGTPNPRNGSSPAVSCP